MKKKFELSFKAKFLILYSSILLLGFVLFFIIGFSSDKWFYAWLTFGVITIVPNVYYFILKYRIDTKNTHSYQSHTKLRVRKPRFIPSLFYALASFCFGPIILTGIVLATLLGAAI